MTIAYNVIGLIGSFSLSLSIYTQLYKVIKTKKASDISLIWQSFYLFGITMLLIYGLGEDLWPIYFPISVELFGGLVLLGFKLYYDRLEVKQAKELALSPDTNV